MAAENKNLDRDTQMLVYENYNKFISATDTIRRMKENVSGMESSMDQLLTMVTAVRGKSDGINASLCERRERIEELNGTRSLLRKVQFIFDLPQRLRKCMSAEDYVGAVKHYEGALPILKAYAQSSFRPCKEESDAIMRTLIKRLQAQVMDRSVLLPARAQAVSLLQQLNHPALKTSASRDDLHAEGEKDFIQEFLDKAVTFREQFPNGEGRLVQASSKFFDEYFEIVQRSLQPERGNISAAQLNACFRHPTSLTNLIGIVHSEQLSMDVTRMSGLVPETNLPARASEAVENAVRNHVTRQFQSLLDRIKASLTVVDLSRKPDFKQPPKTLKLVLEIAQKTIIDGSLEVLQDLKELRKLYLLSWADEYTDLVQGGFQELFTNLVDHFLFLCVRSAETPLPSDKSQSAQIVTPSLVLLVSLLSIYLYQTAVPQITELVGTWFPGGGAMGSEGRPAFVPSEICRFFNTTGERLLQQYVDIQARALSVIVRKAVDSPNWLKFKEPQDVRMFTDLLLQEVERLQADVQQLLAPGPPRSHRYSDRFGSNIGSSRSASTREDGLRIVSNRSHARSQLLEKDVVRLFTKKVEIFTKLEYNQPWVISTVVKMTLKTFEEYARLQTFSRGGYQQIQLDCHYLRELLQNLADNGVVEIMLDEVCSAASERCQDPVPLETLTLDRHAQMKKAKMESAKEEPPI